MKNQTNELAIIKKISPVVMEAQKLVINSKKSLSEAVVFLSKCNKYLDEDEVVTINA